jgi:hypothetical protein
MHQGRFHPMRDHLKKLICAAVQLQRATAYSGATCLRVTIVEMLSRCRSALNDSLKEA